jgi:hypothetical protein
MTNLDVSGLVPVWHRPKEVGCSLDNIIAVGEILRDGEFEFYVAPSGVAVSTKAEANAFMCYGTNRDFKVQYYALQLNEISGSEFKTYRRFIDYTPTIGLNVPQRLVR